jgi:hypothetical protein
MPKVDLTIEEPSSDFRERELALKMTLRNSGTIPIELVALSPRIPEGVLLLETKDFSLLATKSQFTELCTQLEYLVKDVLVVTDEAFRARYIQIMKDALSSIVQSGFFRGYYQYVSGYYFRRMEEAKKQEQALFIRIQSSDDAKRIFTDFIEKSQTDDAVKRAFAFKMDKVEKLEKELGQGVGIEAAAIATIEPDSFFSATYILRFPRNWLDPSRFTVSVEATYRESAKPERHNGIATTTITVSPSPYVLTLISMVSAVLGVVLKHAVADLSSGRRDWNPALIPATDLIVGVILALVFFNAFEFTPLLQDLRKNLGWRSAMLIGVISGLASDRILAAIKSLVGT